MNMKLSTFIRLLSLGCDGQLKREGTSDSVSGYTHHYTSQCWALHWNVALLAHQNDEICRF